jgi:hypothetical protein
MTKTEAINRAGTAAKLAKILGVSNQAVSKWDVLPKARLWQLKVIKPSWFRKARRPT